MEGSGKCTKFYFTYRFEYIQIYKIIFNAQCIYFPSIVMLKLTIMHISTLITISVFKILNHILLNMTHV